MYSEKSCHGLWLRNRENLPQTYALVQHSLYRDSKLGLQGRVQLLQHILLHKADANLDAKETTVNS